jgi:hypothetical protein
MGGYTKLFSDIVESSIWNEAMEIRLVWITLLALSDQDGYVRGSVGWLAGKSRVSKEACAKAIELFQKPDHESRTPDNEGRRIEQLEDGWLILNYLSFRDRLSNDAKATATRLRVQKHRERYKALRNTESVTPSHSASASVSVTDSEGSQEGGFTLEDCKKAAGGIGMRPEQIEKFFHHFNALGWMGTGGRRITNLASQLAKWKANEPSMGKSFNKTDDEIKRRDDAIDAARRKELEACYK